MCFVLALLVCGPAPPAIDVAECFILAVLVCGPALPAVDVAECFILVVLVCDPALPAVILLRQAARSETSAINMSPSPEPAEAILAGMAAETGASIVSSSPEPAEAILAGMAAETGASIVSSSPEPGGHPRRHGRGDWREHRVIIARACGGHPRRHGRGPWSRFRCFANCAISSLRLSLFQDLVQRTPPPLSGPSTHPLCHTESLREGGPLGRNGGTGDAVLDATGPGACTGACGAGAGALRTPLTTIRNSWLSMARVLTHAA